jgi:hypothetical protein
MCKVSGNHKASSPVSIKAKLHENERHSLPSTRSTENSSDCTEYFTEWTIFIASRAKVIWLFI